MSTLKQKVSTFCLRFWPYLLIIIFSFLLYGHTLNYGYTHFDDTTLILDRIDRFTTWSNLPIIFTSSAWFGDEGIYYRPLQNLSYMLDAHLSNLADINHIDGTLPAFHCHNLLLFALVICLIFYILDQIFHTPRLLAFCLALFVLCNPLFTSLATWIPARGDLQALIFICLCFICFVHYLQQKSWLWLSFTALTFALAIFSKEVAGLTPLVLLSYFFICHFQPPAKKAAHPWQKICQQILTRQNIILALIFIGITCFWFYLYQLSHFTSTTVNNLRFVNLFINTATIPETIFKFFFVTNFFLTAVYSPANIVGGSILLILFIFLIIKNKNRAPLIFSWFWFFIFIIPPMFFRNEIITDFFSTLEHRSLLPLIGIIIFLSFLLQKISFFQQDTSLIMRQPKLWWQQQTPFGRIFCCLFVFIILNFGWRSWQYSLSFRNPIIFNQTAVDYSPSFANLNNLASSYYLYGHYNTALDIFQQIETRAIIPDSYRSVYFNQRAILKGDMQQFAAAIDDFNLALEGTSSAYQDETARILINRGISKSKLHQYQDALADFELSLQLNPESSNAANMRQEMLEKIASASASE